MYIYIYYISIRESTSRHIDIFHHISSWDSERWNPTPDAAPQAARSWWDSGGRGLWCLAPKGAVCWPVGREAGTLAPQKKITWELSVDYSRLLGPTLFQDGCFSTSKKAKVAGLKRVETYVFAYDCHWLPYSGDVLCRSFSTKPRWMWKIGDLRHLQNPAV